jgi:glucan endo-1,3-beta-D-glucosidase
MRSELKIICDTEANVVLVSETPMASLPITVPVPTVIPSELPKPIEISPPNILIDLSGLYEIPHLLVPIDLSNAGNIIGNRYVAQISSTHSTLFNFDIPPEYQGKTCNLVFHVPPESQEWWHPWHLTTPGGIIFSKLEVPATAISSSDSVSSSSSGPIGAVNSLESGGYLVNSAPCEAGKKLGYRADALGATDLQYFQMTSPVAGLFMTVSG